MDTIDISVREEEVIDDKVQVSFKMIQIPYLRCQIVFN